MVLDEKGRIMSIAPRDRLDAHRLVEDYMIAANVAAARALEAKKAPVMYRVHEPPSREKLVALKDYLDDLRGRVRARPGDQAGHLQPHHRAASATATAARRSWSNCCAPRCRRATAPERLGHFGLALATYAHFTSPIRRYADLLVHRALVSAYKLGEGGLPPGEDEKFEQIGEQISMLERRAMEAERDTVDRYVAAFLADQVGQLVECRITGVQPFGFFATVEDLGGDGLVLAKDLGQRIFPLRRERREQLVGDETGETYRVGQRLTLRLAEANPVSGSLRFELPEGSYGGAARPRRDRVRTDRRARPAGQHPPQRPAPLTAVATFAPAAYWARKQESSHGLQDRDHRRQPSQGQHQPQGRAVDLRARAATISTARSSRSAICRSTTRISTPTRPSNGRASASRSRPPTASCSSAPNIIAAFPACSRMRSTSARGPMARACSTRSPAAIVTASPGAIGGFGANHQIRQACVFLNMPVMQQPEAYLGHVSDDSFDESGCLKDGPLKDLVDGASPMPSTTGST